jgi:hypothetical protein
LDRLDLVHAGNQSLKNNKKNFWLVILCGQLGLS